MRNATHHWCSGMLIVSEPVPVAYMMGNCPMEAVGEGHELGPQPLGGTIHDGGAQFQRDC